ncbi:MAG: ATP synthase F0 subunit B [Treponema sp.]|jgi:F-type H+-transporting ATPase subunit b|nr:ATP synthase F0 subunit B [Treponema sp.]
MLDFSVTFFITIINVLVLYFILKRILFKPVSGFMLERSKKISEAVEQAEKDKNEAKALLDQYEKQLETVDAQAEEIIKSARVHSEEEAEQIKADALKQAQAIIAAARVKTEGERAAAAALFRVEAAALVTQAAAKLLKRELSGAEQLRYAAQALNEMEQHV